MEIELFNSLDQYFKSHGLLIYMVGGTARDYLLKRELTDFDFATNATPEELKTLFKDQKTPFIHLGSISVKYLQIKVDITCFRKETDYVDYRHPKTIEFSKKILPNYPGATLAVETYLALFAMKENHSP